MTPNLCNRCSKLTEAKSKTTLCNFLLAKLMKLHLSYRLKLDIKIKTYFIYPITV